MNFHRLIQRLLKKYADLQIRNFSKVFIWKFNSLDKMNEKYNNVVVIILQNRVPTKGKGM